MKLGVYGGTFDPVHSGHLAVAEEVQRQLGLDEVLFVPAGQPWMKAAGPLAPARHRLEMVRRAVAGRAGLSVSAMEVERPGPSYTLQTLEELGRQRPGDELYLILSWESLAEFPRWYRPEGIIRLCRLVVVPRPGAIRPDLAALDRAVPGLAERTLLLEGPLVDISATEVRRRLREGQPVEGLLPPAVRDYIQKKGLYGVG